MVLYQLWSDSDSNHCLDGSLRDPKIELIKNFPLLNTVVVPKLVVVNIIFSLQMVLPHKIHLKTKNFYPVLSFSSIIIN